MEVISSLKYRFVRMVKIVADGGYRGELIEKVKMALNWTLEIIQKKKNTKKKIPFGDLDDNQKFETSVNERKFFLDTIKIIAYSVGVMNTCTPYEVRVSP